MLWMMRRAGKKNSNNRDFQFWQQNNEPIELNTNGLWNNTVHYYTTILLRPDLSHRDPYGMKQPKDWIYSSSRDYGGEKGLLKIILLDNFQKYADALSLNGAF
jgi:putative transposase